MFKVNNKELERRQGHTYLNKPAAHISHLVLVFLLLTLSR